MKASLERCPALYPFRKERSDPSCRSSSGVAMSTKKPHSSAESAFSIARDDTTVDSCCWCCIEFLRLWLLGSMDNWRSAKSRKSATESNADEDCVDEPCDLTEQLQFELLLRAVNAPLLDCECIMGVGNKIRGMVAWFVCCARNKERYCFGIYFWSAERIVNLLDNFTLRCCMYDGLLMDINQWDRWRDFDLYSLRQVSSAQCHVDTLSQKTEY